MPPTTLDTVPGMQSLNIRLDHLIEQHDIAHMDDILSLFLQLPGGAQRKMVEETVLLEGAFQAESMSPQEAFYELLSGYLGAYHAAHEKALRGEPFESVNLNSKHVNAFEILERTCEQARPVNVSPDTVPISSARLSTRTRLVLAGLLLAGAIAIGHQLLSDEPAADQTVEDPAVVE